MSKTKIVVVGASAGGVEALSALFADMPPSLPLAFFVTLHRPPDSCSSLPSILERYSGLTAKHPRDGENLTPGMIYVSPPDFHLVVGNGVVRLSRGPKEHHNRPSIDPLFRSAAQVYGKRVIGVLLSGLLHDGVEGLKEIKRHGGLAVVQDPAEAQFAAMIQAALAKVEIDYCAPLAQIRVLLTRSHDLPKVPKGESLSRCVGAIHAAS